MQKSKIYGCLSIDEKYYFDYLKGEKMYEIRDSLPVTAFILLYISRSNKKIQAIAKFKSFYIFNNKKSNFENYDVIWIPDIIINLIPEDYIELTECPMVSKIWQSEKYRLKNYNKLLKKYLLKLCGLGFLFIFLIF